VQLSNASGVLAVERIQSLRRNHFYFVGCKVSRSSTG
jgi:hypothetical protein